MQRGAVVQNVAALHVVVGRPSPLGNYAAASVSEEIATLRRLLFGFEDKWTQTGKWFKDAIEGSEYSGEVDTRCPGANRHSQLSR